MKIVHWGILYRLVQKVLEEPHSYQWQWQGLGMLRLYLSDEVRLHVWFPRGSVPGVSTIHTHPWDFVSTVIVGRVVNQRYLCVTPRPEAEPYWRRPLICGPGGGLTAHPQEPVWIQRQPPEIYTAGQNYFQKASEIHESDPAPGTVTAITRTFKADRDTAMVYWPKDTEWVSAEPRDATPTEIDVITQRTLQEWFYNRAQPTPK